MATDPKMRSMAATLALVLLAWEIVGRLKLVGQGALPAPSEILQQAWLDRADYPAHIWGTVRTSIAGFAIGNIIAIALGFLFASFPRIGRLMSGVNITIFAMPSIALVPILVIALQGDTPRVALSALSVYYPTMVATVLGLSHVDPRLCDLVRVYGGSRWKVLSTVRIRAGLPTLLSGLRVAAPAAVLGSLLAEFGSGGTAGLGTYLIGSLGRAEPSRLWGIGLTATAISGLAYLLVNLVARRHAQNTTSVTLQTGSTPDAPADSLPLTVLTVAGAVALPFCLWWACVALLSALGVSDVVLRTPLDVFSQLALADTAGDNLATIGSALASTLPFALAGMVAGLCVALVLATLGHFWRELENLLLPVSLVTQSMPLVALTPLVVLVFGRGAATILVITVSVTFFPAYVTISQGLALVPEAMRDLVRAYGGGRWRQYLLIALPSSLPHLCAATRLAAPRALLGVMIAEWLATGTGIGNLLNESRGMLDFSMIWSVSMIAIAIAVAFHLAVAALERAVLHRYAMTATH